MARLRQQQAAKHGQKEEALGRRSSPTRGEQPGETNAPPAGRPSSSEGGNAEDAFRVQVASFAELDGLTRENHKALEEVKHLLEKSAAGSFPPGTGLPDADKLLELDRMVCSAKALGEVAVSWYNVDIFVVMAAMRGAELSRWSSVVWCIVHRSQHYACL